MGMFDKMKQLGELKKMRDQALAIQRQLAAQTITIDEDGIRIVISGDQKIQELEVQGIQNSLLVDKLNKALKKSQEMAAKQLQEMSGGLSGLMKGMGGGS
jgi:hypothetical protein